MIKKAMLEDIEYIVQLEKRILGQTLGKSYLEHLATLEMAGVFKYEEENIIKGYISFTINGNYIEMLNVVVDDKYQKSGIGTKLVEHVIKYKDDHMLQSIILEVNVNNVAAQVLYSKCGFEKMLTRRNFYKVEDKFEDAVVMIKE